MIATPLPEPLIPDQVQRQRDNAALFDPATPLPVERAILARYGVRSLVVDADYLSPRERDALAGLARPVSTSGPLMRWDIRP